MAWFSYHVKSYGIWFLVMPKWWLRVEAREWCLNGYLLVPNGLQRTQLFCLSLLTTKCQVKELQQVLRRQDSNATKVPLSTPLTQLTFSGCVHQRYLNSWSQKMGFIPRTSCTVLRPLPKSPRTTRDGFGPCFVAWWCILLAFVMKGRLLDCFMWRSRWRFKCNSNTYPGPGLNLQERPGNLKKIKGSFLGSFLLECHVS